MTRRKFSDEFERDAVQIVTGSGGPIAQVARQLRDQRLDVGSSVKQDEIRRGVRDGVTTAESEEVVALRH